jgi:hypothetical protein
VADRLRPPEAAPAPAVPQIEMTPDDAADFKVLNYMARNDPKKAHLPGEFAAFVQKAYAYQDTWQNENEGAEFDWEHAEHAKWHRANFPAGIIQAEVDEARDDMKVDERVEKRLAPIREEQEKREKAERTAAEYERVRPKINARVNSLVVTMVDAVDADLGRMLKDEKGNPDLRTETGNAVEEADPLAHELLNSAAAEAIPIWVELEKTGQLTDYAINPAKNEVHALIQQHIDQAESRLLAAPAAEQVFNGRQLIRIGDMIRRKQNIIHGPGTNEQKKQKIDDLEAAYTCLTVDDLQEIIRDDIAARTKLQLERLNGVAKRKFVRGGVESQPAPQKVERQPAPQPEPQPQQRPQPPAPPPRPPSLSSGSDMLTPGNPAGGGAKGHGDAVADVLFK